MRKILIPVTNHGTLGNTDEKNGTYAPELTHALEVFLAAGFEYQIISIKGGVAPLYGTDIEGDEVNASVLADSEFQRQIQNTLTASEVNIKEFDGIFYPGGFGCLTDLAEDKTVAAVAARHIEQGGVVGAVCHGPAALLPIVLSNGNKLLADKQVTAFTREEEVDFATINKIPYLLEESLSRSAAKFSKVQPWGEHVVVDGRLVTGQNPASAHGVAVAMKDLMSQS